MQYVSKTKHLQVNHSTLGSWKINRNCIQERLNMNGLYLITIAASNSPPFFLSPPPSLPSHGWKNRTCEETPKVQISPFVRKRICPHGWKKLDLRKKPLSPNFSFCEKRDPSSWMKKIGLLKKPLGPNFSFCEKRDPPSWMKKLDLEAHPLKLFPLVIKSPRNPKNKHAHMFTHMNACLFVCFSFQLLWCSWISDINA
jgi:hypothetical protein